MAPYYDYYDEANNFENNQHALKETRDIQQSTLAALERTRRRAAEAKQVGQATLTKLEEQNKQLDNTQQKADHLNDELKKADKLQNKFALHSLQWGNKRAAKKEIRLEEGPIPEKPKATFKRRGRRPKNKKVAPAVQKNWEDEDSSLMMQKKNLNWEDEDSSSLQMKKVVNKTVETSKDIKTEVNRNELFAGADTTAATKKPAGTFKRRGPRPKKNTKPVALTQTDQEELNQIHDTDK